MRIHGAAKHSMRLIGRLMDLTIESLDNIRFIAIQGEMSPKQSDMLVKMKRLQRDAKALVVDFLEDV